MLGHNYSFSKTSYLEQIVSRELIIDVIELFYEGPDSKFLINGFTGKISVAGRCMYIGQSTFKIDLSREVIEDFVSAKLAAGGNTFISDIKTAIISVLVHEIQHANQFAKRHEEKWLWTGKKYLVRPCEIDARKFVDDNLKIIESISGLNEMKPSKKKANHEEIVREIVETFSFFPEKSVKKTEIIEELKMSGVYNAVNLKRAIGMIRSNGKSIS